MTKDGIKSDKAQSDAIEVLRFPLIVLVVFVHMLPFERQPWGAEWDMEKFYLIFSQVISYIIGRLAVPSFFLFSGYFFFLKLKKWSSSYFLVQLEKRFFSLLIPYIVWNLITCMAILAKNMVFQSIGYGADEEYAGLSELSVVDIFWRMPINYPMWFMRDLITMSLLAPVFYLLLKYLKAGAVFILLAFYLLNFESNVPGLSTTAIFYFGLGAYMGLYKHNMLSLMYPYRHFSGVLCIILLIVTACLLADPIHEYLLRFLVVCSLPSLLYVGSCISSKKRWKSLFMKLSGAVFFIYALHNIYLLSWLKGAFSKTFLANSPGGMLLGYITIPFLCIAIILLLYFYLKKISPKALSFITGNRI